MIQIEFNGPQQKSYIIPQNKSVYREKEKSKKVKKQKEKQEIQMLEQMKLTKVLNAAKKIPTLDQDLNIMKFIMNAQDPKDFTKPEEVKKVKKDDLSFTEQPEVIKKTAFLNTAEYQELKDQYADYNIGEYVLKFPNPDFVGLVDRPITIQEAENIFNTQLAIETEGGIPISLLKKQKKVFLQTYLQLDNYVEKDPKKIAKMKEEQKKREKTMKNTIFNKQDKESKENKDILQYKGYWEQYGRKNDDDDDEVEEMLNKSKMKIEEQNNNQSKDQINKSKDQINKSKDQVNKSKDQVNTSNIEMIEKDKPVEVEGGNQDNIYNAPYQLQSPDDQLKQLLKLRTTKTKNYSILEKKYCRGGYLYKKYTEDKTDYDWVQMNLAPQDFLTLIRHTIITKLTRDGHFHCRQFISTDDQFIFVVLKSKLGKIKQVAELQGMLKQYELGYADILSLEPCDQKLRPLRLKQYIRDPDFASKAEDYIEEEKTDGKKKISRIEADSQKIYQGVIKWGDQELRGHVVITQKKLDPLIRRMAQELHISLNQEKVAITDDHGMSRETWESYHIYQLYLVDYLQRVFSADANKEIKQNKGFLFKLIYRKAIGDSNELYRNFHSSVFSAKLILQHLWDRQGIPPIAPYGQYFTTSENESLWRKYEISEKGHRAEFMNVEKLKIANSLIAQHINVKKLVEFQLINSYFAIHDPYQLLGMPKAGMFKPLIDIQLISEQKSSIGLTKLNDLFVSLKDEAEGADFDGDSLAEETRIRYCPPWQLPIDVIRDYYGEKIALYFRFLQFYTSQLWNIVVAAIICEGVIDNTKGDSQIAFMIIFSVFLITWSSYFLAHWRRQQVMFQIEFGQQSDSQANEVERPAFDGNFIRSIENDKLNEEIYPSWKKQIKIMISATITLILIVTVVATVIGVFFLKSYFIDHYDNAILINFVPSMINAIVINLFNFIYFNVSTKLNYSENHKYESEYENSLITKTFFFTFINTFNCLAIIAFLDTQFPSLQLCKTSVGLNCYRALKDQMVTIFMVNFAKTLPQLIVPCIKGLIRSESKTVDENLVMHEFNQIDQYIECQADLEPYISNAETDGLMNDYMELIVQFAFLQLFGLAFPLAYFIAFFTNCAQIQVDRLKLIRFMQRPIPMGASDIGNWLFILEIISFLSIFCNAGLVVFTSNSVQTGQSASFSIFVLVFLALKYFSSFIISPFPEKARLILTRHKFAIERVHRGMKSSQKGYNSGIIRQHTEGIDYSKMIKIQQDHLLKGPNFVVLNQK